MQSLLPVSQPVSAFTIMGATPPSTQEKGRKPSVCSSVVHHLGHQQKVHHVPFIEGRRLQFRRGVAV